MDFVRGLEQGLTYTPRYRGGFSFFGGTLPFPSLSLEVGPLKSSYGVWGSAVSSSMVWGGGPAEIEFGAF